MQKRQPRHAAKLVRPERTLKAGRLREGLDLNVFRIAKELLKPRCARNSDDGNSVRRLLQPTGQSDGGKERHFAARLTAQKINGAVGGLAIQAHPPAVQLDEWGLLLRQPLKILS